MRAWCVYLVLAAVAAACAQENSGLPPADTPFPMWFQQDERWGSVPIGTTTIHRSGCAATAVAMGLRGMGVRMCRQSGCTQCVDINSPADFVRMYAENNGFTASNNMLWNTVQTLSDLAVTVRYAHDLDYETARVELNGPRPAFMVVRVSKTVSNGRLLPKTSMHWVLVTGTTDTGLIVHDPGSARGYYHDFPMDGVHSTGRYNLYVLEGADTAACMVPPTWVAPNRAHAAANNPPAVRHGDTNSNSNSNDSGNDAPADQTDDNVPLPQRRPQPPQQDGNADQSTDTDADNPADDNNTDTDNTADDNNTDTDADNPAHTSPPPAFRPGAIEFVQPDVLSVGPLEFEINRERVPGVERHVTDALDKYFEHMTLIEGPNEAVLSPPYFMRAVGDSFAQASLDRTTTAVANRGRFEGLEMPSHVTFGKSTPEMLMELLGSAVNANILSDGGSPAYYRQFLGHVGAGIDCSGYVTYALNHAMQVLHTPNFREIPVMWAHSSGLGGRAQIHGAQLFETLNDPADVRPGDTLYTRGHIRVIAEVARVGDVRLLRVHESRANSGGRVPDVTDSDELPPPSSVKDPGPVTTYYKVEDGKIFSYRMDGSWREIGTARLPQIARPVDLAHTYDLVRDGAAGALGAADDARASPDEQAEEAAAGEPHDGATSHATPSVGHIRASSITWDRLTLQELQRASAQWASRYGANVAQFSRNVYDQWRNTREWREQAMETWVDESLEQWAQAVSVWQSTAALREQLGRAAVHHGQVLLHHAGDVAGDALQTAGHLGQQAWQHGRPMAEEALQTAGHLGQQAWQHGRPMAEEALQTAGEMGAQAWSDFVAWRRRAAQRQREERQRRQEEMAANGGDEETMHPLRLPRAF